MADEAQRRREKHRARVKAHFDKKRKAAASAASKPKKTTYGLGKPGKTVVVDAGHNPSEATLKLATQMAREGRPARKQPSYKAKDRANTQRVVKTTAPKTTPNSAAAKPVVEVPRADASVAIAKPSEKKNIAAGVLTALGAGALVAGAVKLARGGTKAEAKAPKSIGLAKPAGEIIPKQKAKSLSQLRVKPTLATPKVLGLPGREKLPAPLKGLPGRDKTSKRATLDDLRTKTTAAQKAVAATKKTTGSKIAEAERRAAGKTPRPTQETSMSDAAQEARARAAIREAQKGVRHRPPQEAIDVHDRRAADRRQGEATRRGPDRAKKGDVEGAKGRQRSNRRKPGSDPRGATPKLTTPEAKFGATPADVAKVARSGETTAPPTAAQQQKNAAALRNAPTEVQSMAAEIDALKKEIAERKAKLKIQTVEAPSTKGAPKPVDKSSAGQAPMTKTANPNVAEVPKGAPVQAAPSGKKATPDGAEPKKTTAKPGGIKLQPPSTTSEEQRRRKANQQYYRDKSMLIDEAKNPILPKNVPQVTTTNVSDPQSVAEQQRRAAERSKVKLSEGYKPVTPQMKAKSDKVGAAERAGVSESEIKKVARKLPTVEAPESPTAKPKSKQAPKPVSQTPRGLPTRSSGFELGEPKPASKPKDGGRIAEINKRIAELEKATAEPKADKPKISKEEAFRQYEELKVEEKAKVAKQARLPAPNLKKLHVLPTAADIKAEQSRAKQSKPAAPPKLHKPISTPVAQDLESNIKRKAARDASTKPAKQLKSPAIGLHSKPASAAKATVKGGALLAGLFAALSGGEAAAAEHDPSKRAAKAKEAFKKEGKSAAKSIAGYTAAAALTKAALGKAASGAIFSGVLPIIGTAAVGKEYTIPKLKDLGAQIEGAYTSRREAREEKKASEAKYGTIEAATKTRHAKEAYKKAQAKHKSKDLLTG